MDLVSIAQSVAAAAQSTVHHFIYLSVAQPAPIMREYVAVRAEWERMLRESGLPSTFVRVSAIAGAVEHPPHGVQIIDADEMRMRR